MTEDSNMGNEQPYAGYNAHQRMLTEDKLRLVKTERAWEDSLTLIVCLILGAVLIVGLVMFR